MNFKLLFARMYLPSRLKQKGLLDMYCNLAGFIHEECERGIIGHTALKDAFGKIGKASAVTLKKELTLGNSFEDAVNAWIIGSKAMNVTVSVERKEREVIFNHLHCPMWENFKKNGKILCEDVCIPVAESMAREIYPDVEMVILQESDMNHTCIKALKAPE